MVVVTAVAVDMAALAHAIAAELVEATEAIIVALLAAFAVLPATKT